MNDFSSTGSISTIAIRLRSAPPTEGTLDRRVMLDEASEFVVSSLMSDMEEYSEEEEEVLEGCLVCRASW